LTILTYISSVLMLRSRRTLKVKTTRMSISKRSRRDRAWRWLKSKRQMLRPRKKEMERFRRPRLTMKKQL